MRTLTPAERRAFRAQAHALHPFVSIGQHGLTPAVLHEIDVNLVAHELIKIRVFNDDRGERETLLARICSDLDAAPIQHLGKILTIWRPAPAPAPEPDPVAPRSDRRNRTRTPAPREPAAGKKTPAGRATVGTQAKRAPRRGPSVIQGGEPTGRRPRGAAASPGAKPASRRAPRPHGKSASSSVGASGARRRRKAR
jgi:putative YhbY family RNA-binding protein